MSGVSSLLKYRYQKKTTEQNSGRSSPIFSSSASNSQDDDNAGQASHSTLTTSPIFPSKHLIPNGSTSSKDSSSENGQTSASAKRLIIPEPRSASEASRLSSSSKTEPVAATATTVAEISPWLSKERAITENAGCKIRKPIAKSRSRIMAQFASSDDEDSNDADSLSTTSSRLSSSMTADQRDLEASVRRLADMFPNVERCRLEEAVNFADGDLDRAIDHVIQLTNEKSEANQAATVEQRKRKLAFYQSSGLASSDKLFIKPPVLEKQVDLTSPELSPFQPPPFKKARPLCFSDESPSSSQTNELSLLDKPAAPSEPVIDFQTAEERIHFLGEAFPDISRRELKRVLTENKFDLEKSISTFVSYQAIPSSKLLSQTTNVGSIKAFMESRAQAKAVATSSISPDGSAAGIIKKNERRRVIMHSDDDDEDAVKVTAVDRDENSRSVNHQILEFFNVATIDEMTIMNGCSRKKAEVIAALRPFSDYNDLESKLMSSYSLPANQLISEAREVTRLRSTVQALMERCRRISEEQERFVADLTNRTSMDALANDRRYVTKQPSILTPSMTLAPYQMVGLNWLILMHAHGFNGILGDEMGLGKTIQTIAFLAHLHSEGVHGPHVIVAPSSTIDNWLRELRTWCPSLNVLLYYGSQEARRSLRYDLLDGTIDDFQILVTTYNMATGSIDDRSLFKKFKFHYAIFDEGHMLKNMTSVRYKSLMRIMARRRLLLTGTPLQNNLIELMSLLAFLVPDLFDGKADVVKRIFSTFSNNGETRGTYEMQTLAHAKQILKPFFLRRLKSEVLQQLPAKRVSVIRVPMPFEQQDLYDELVSKFSRDLDAEQSEGNKVATTNSNGGAAQVQSGMSMMMLLRKVANHHLLHRNQFDDNRLRQMAALWSEDPSHSEANVDYVFEDMQVMSDFELHKLCRQHQVLHPFCLDSEQITDSGKFRHLDEVLPVMKSKGDRVLLFSQFTMMLDIIEEYMTSRNHRYLRLDGSTPVADRQGLIDQFNTDASLFVFLLSTRAGGLGINLTAANIVILHDIDFNPYNDKQAEDRCHRVGQQRDVNIYRLISKNTIEEAMLRCAEAKLKLENDVTGGDLTVCDDLSSVDVASLLKEALQMGSNS